MGPVCVCAEHYYDQEDDRTDEEADPIFSEDEAVTQRGLRRSQSVKITRSRVRKDVSGREHQQQCPTMSPSLSTNVPLPPTVSLPLH